MQIPYILSLHEENMFNIFQENIKYKLVLYKDDYILPKLDSHLNNNDINVRKCQTKWQKQLPISNAFPV